MKGDAQSYQGASVYHSKKMRSAEEGRAHTLSAQPIF